MSPIFKTFTKIAAWALFISGFTSLVVPTIIGMTTGALAGSINDVEAGQLWFYRHGLSYLIGLCLLWGYFQAVKMLKD